MKIIRINDIPNPEEESCKTCVFSFRKKYHYRCKRYPPQIDSRNSAWPKVEIYDWCGEYVEDPKEK